MNSILATAAIAVVLAVSQVVQQGAVTVTRVLEPKRELRFEVLVPAHRDSVWHAFATADGLETWLWRDCTVDLRKGGAWIVNYPGGKTGGGTIERLRPGRDITLHAMAPEWFPAVRSKGTTAKFEFEALNDTATRVRLRQTGWETGAEWDSAYNYLAKGNAQLLGQLRRRFESGPIDWDAVERRRAQQK